jgi:hypothetical protein
MLFPFAPHPVSITPFYEDFTTEIRISRIKCNFDRMNRMNRIQERQGSNGLADGLSCKSCSSCLPFFSEIRPDQAQSSLIRLFLCRPPLEIPMAFVAKGMSGQ